MELKYVDSFSPRFLHPSGGHPEPGLRREPGGHREVQLALRARPRAAADALGPGRSEGHQLQCLGCEAKRAMRSGRRSGRRRLVGGRQGSFILLGRWIRALQCVKSNP